MCIRDSGSILSRLSILLFNNVVVYVFGMLSIVSLSSLLGTVKADTFVSPVKENVLCSGLVTDVSISGISPG